MAERRMDDTERIVLKHAAEELRVLASRMQWVAGRTPLPTSAFDESDLLSVATGAECAAEWIQALLLHGHWGTPDQQKGPA